MAQQTIPGGFDVPHKDVTAGIPALSFAGGCFLTGTGTQKVAWVFQVPKTGTLDKAELMCNFVNAPSDVKISFQDVDLATGNPDGVVDQFRVMTGLTAIWTVPGLMTSTGADGGVKRSVTRGDLLALVTEWNSATTGEVDWAGIGNNSNTEMVWSCYWLSHNGTSYTKRTPAVYAPFVLKYDDGTYEVPAGVVYPVSAVNARTFNSGSTPDERALYFSFPVPVTVDGGWLQLDLDANCDIVLYDTDGTTTLASVTLDTDLRPGTSGAPMFFRFATAVTLTASGNYRLAVKPGGSSVTLYEFTVSSAAIMNALAGGSGFQLSTRTDAGAWTQTTTQRPWGGLHVSKLDDAVSSGAGAFSAAYVG